MQLGGHRRADLDGADRTTSGEEIPGRLPCPGPDFQDLGIGWQQVEERVEQAGGVRGPHLVVGLGDLVERDPSVVRSAHGGILAPVGSDLAMPGVPCIAGVSKIAYATATGFRLQWRHGPPRLPVGASPSYAQDRARQSGDPRCQRSLRSSCSRRSWRPLSRARRPRSASRPVAQPRWTRLTVIPDGVVDEGDGSFPTAWWTRPTASFPTGWRSRCSTTRCRRWATSTRISSMPCVGRRRRRSRRRRASGQQRLAVARVSAAVVAGGGRRARLAGRGRAVGVHCRRRLLTCRVTRSTSARPRPRRGCPSTVPRPGCARSTATSPGTSSCVPMRSTTVARRCTRIRPRTRGCSRESGAGRAPRRSGALPPPTLQTLPGAVAANVVEVRARTRSTIMAVVKADGYGHGAVTVARAAVAAGAGWLGTTSVAEAACVARRAVGGADPHLAAPLRDRRGGGGSRPGRCRGRVGGRARRAARARRVDGAGPPPRGHRDVPGRLPPRAVGRAHRSRPAWSTGSEGPRRGGHGALPLADRADPAANASAVARMPRRSRRSGRRGSARRSPTSRPRRGR